MTTFEPGCYFDGARGCHLIDALYAFAEAFGFQSQDCDCSHCSEPDCEGIAGCEFANELEDSIDDFLNAAFGLEGFSWGRNESGDYGLWANETDEEILDAERGHP